MVPPTTATRKYQPMTRKYQPIFISSTNSSFVRSVIWKCFLINKKMVLINKTLMKKKTSLFQTATLSCSRQGKNQRNPSRACLPFSHLLHTAQKMKFSNKDFFSKYDQIRRFQRIWSHLLTKPLMENFFFVECKKLKVVLMWRCLLRYS